MKKFAILLAAALAAFAQQPASVTLDGNAITLKPVTPMGKTRAAAGFRTDADLTFKGFSVPKGDYTFYVLADGSQWQLAVSTATGPKAATYDPKLDLGRVPLAMAKTTAPAAACKIVLTKSAALAAKVEVTWNDTAASTSFHVDRGAADMEW